MHLQFIASHINLASSPTPISEVPAVIIPIFPPSNLIGFLNNNTDDEFFPVSIFTFNFLANNMIFL